jgi:fluoride ion exporter CrcB/FEX
MTKFFLIACGGALGAPLRYFINDLMKHSSVLMLPSGIMLVNFIGCFCVGIAMAYISDLKSNVYFFFNRWISWLFYNYVSLLPANN